MKKPETNLVTQMRHYIKERYPYAKFHKNETVANTGVPDIFICINGQMIVCEAKVHPNTPEPAQLRELRDWALSGAHVGIAYSTNELQSIINGWGGNEKYVKVLTDMIERRVKNAKNAIL